VIAVDTNILVYAHQAGIPAHGRARRRLAELAEGDEPWAIPVTEDRDFARFPGFATGRL
jgi:predicted nucleic acid-binding protein